MHHADLSPLVFGLVCLPLSRSPAAVWVGALSGCAVAIVIGIIFICIFYIAQNAVFSGQVRGTHQIWQEPACSRHCRPRGRTRTVACSNQHTPPGLAIIALHLHLQGVQPCLMSSVQGKAIFTGFVTLLASYLITLLAFAMLKFKNYEKKWEMKLAGATATQVGALCKGHNCLPGTAPDAIPPSCGSKNGGGIIILNSTAYACQLGRCRKPPGGLHAEQPLHLVPQPPRWLCLLSTHPEGWPQGLQFFDAWVMPSLHNV